MKTAYFGGSKGYRPTYYQPGRGWTATGDPRHRRLSRPLTAHGSGVRLSPLSLTQPRRPGLMTKVVILFAVLAISLAMVLVFGGLTL